MRNKPNLDALFQPPLSEIISKHAHDVIDVLKRGSSLCAVVDEDLEWEAFLMIAAASHLMAGDIFRKVANPKYDTVKASTELMEILYPSIRTSVIVDGEVR